MPRRPRTFAAGLLYHVIARGNHREATFLDTDDYQAYLHRLALYRTQHAVTLYTYCLMPNHVHLLVRTGAVPLAKFMQGVQQSYTQRFNRVHDKVGHLFQGRYRAIICQDEPYLATLIRYIHLNPVRAGLVDDPGAYAYSGHDAYVAGRASPVADPSDVLAQLGGVEGYRRLMGPPWPVAGHPDDLDRSPAEPAVAPRDGWTRYVRDAGPALRGLAAAMGVAVGDLTGPHRGHRAARDRALAAFVLVRLRGHRLVDVARALERDPDRLGTVMDRFATRVADDPALARETRRLAGRVAAGAGADPAANCGEVGV